MATHITRAVAQQLPICDRRREWSSRKDLQPTLYDRPTGLLPRTLLRHVRFVLRANGSKRVIYIRDAMGKLGTKEVLFRGATQSQGEFSCKEATTLSRTAAA